MTDAPYERDDPSTLERFFTFLARPQYAFTSALTGEFQDAVENVARFGEELFTGSWLHGYSAMNLLPGDFGTNERDERPEGSDALRRLGYSVDRGGWGELAANVGVGAILDPLSYVGGIGLGAKAGRLSAGQLVGQAARRSALKRLGLTDEILLKAMNATEAQPVIRATLAEETSRVARNPETAAEALARFGVAPGPWERNAEGLWQQVGGPRFSPPVTSEQAENAFRGLAAKRLGIDLGDNRVVLTGTNAQRELLEAGIRGLEGQRLVKPAGVPTLEIPGLTWHALPGSAEQWSQIGLFTPARALNGVIGLGAPGLSEFLGKMGADAADKLRRTFADRLSFGQIPESVQAESVASAGRLLRDNDAALRRIGETAQGLTPEVDRAIGDQLLKADDLMRKGVTQEQADEALRALGAHPSQVLSDAVGNPTTDAVERLEAIRETLPWLGKGEAADRTRAAWAYQREQARAVGGDEAVRVLDAYVDDARKMPQELVDRGVWAKAEATPFYFPHQANDAMAAFLASGSPSKKVSGRSYAEALADAFTKGRENANLAETLAEFRKVAERYEVPVPDLTEFGAHATDLGSVMETSLTKLWARRVLAHQGTIARADFEKLARERVNDLRHATVLDDFLDASLRGVGARGTTLGKLLGGGEFRLTGLSGEAARSAAPWLGGQAGSSAGKKAWVYKWPGLNSFVKPALYLPAVATYTRNAMGGVVMGAMDPEIGLAGGAGLLSVLRDMPIVRAMQGGPARDLTAAVVAVARGRESGVALAGRKIGAFPAEEVVEQLKGSVLGRNPLADQERFEALGSVREFVEDAKRSDAGGWEAFKSDARAAFTGKGLTSVGTGPRALERYRRFWAPLGRLNQDIEDGLRAGAYMRLIGNGYDPASAAKKVRDTFVDYTYQSGEERMLRDLLPFVRFTLGAGPNAIKGSTGGLGRAVGRASVGSDDGRPLPNEIRRQVSIPVPGMPDTYATSLGLPFEAGGALLGSIPGAAGFFRNTEQNLLGGLSPQPKALLEATTGKQFYSDLPLSDVKPVANLPPAVSHALFGFLPLSRVWGETTKWIDAVYGGDLRQAINATTGVKLRTVDSEREAERVIRRWLEGAVERGEVQQLTRFFARKGDEVAPEVKQALEALAEKERTRRAKS